MMILEQSTHTGTTAAGQGAGQAAGSVTMADITTIQVKTESGSSTFILKLRFDDTISTLKTFLNEHRGSTEPYELRTAFPNKAYEEDTLTLKMAGLIPNATMLMRSLAPK
eukprot:GILK01003803.1.p1 GENE.GILK01003803.1~~GILK01003803.1.p1  ORF type:complete len:110 (+),score=15.84 GILK01003803.1:136-465(+)